MLIRRRQPETWFGRLANEVYLGALVFGALVVAAGVVALLVAFVMEVTNWVQMAD
jgi:hypothetical protein